MHSITLFVTCGLPPVPRESLPYARRLFSGSPLRYARKCYRLTGKGMIGAHWATGFGGNVFVLVGEFFGRRAHTRAPPELVIVIFGCVVLVVVPTSSAHSNLYPDPGSTHQTPRYHTSTAPSLEQRRAPRPCPESRTSHGKSGRIRRTRVQDSKP